MPNNALPVVEGDYRWGGSVVWSRGTFTPGLPEGDVLFGGSVASTFIPGPCPPPLGCCDALRFPTLILWFTGIPCMEDLGDMVITFDAVLPGWRSPRVGTGGLGLCGSCGSRGDVFCFFCGIGGDPNYAINDSAPAEGDCGSCGLVECDSPPTCDGGVFSFSCMFTNEFGTGVAHVRSPP